MGVTARGRGTTGPPRQPGRLRTRALVTLLVSAAAGYVLLLQFSARNADPVAAVRHADLGWVAAAALVAVSGLAAATMSFVGFVPERLSLLRAGMVQLAGAFVNLVTPGGVGGMAIGTRFLLRSGVPARQAVASVGASQAVGVVLHLLLILVFGWPAGARRSSLLSPSPALLLGLLIGVAAVTAVLLLTAAVAPLRRRAAAGLHGLFAGVLPRLRELLRHPARLAVGVAGQLLVSLASVAGLYLCVRAFGQYPGFAAVAVADLVGGAIGAAVPTPGGVGGVEAALSLALEQTAHLPQSAAVPAVLLFRVLTFWLPVLPGWSCFLWLQRRRAV